MTTADILPLIRRGILAVLVIGCVGLIGELVLLEHYTEVFQLTPLVLLGATLLITVWHWRDSGAGSVRALQVIGLLLVVGGATGMMFHGYENYEHAREDEPELMGMALVMYALRGEAPSLAPGTLVQFGLLALLYAYKHPALKPRTGG